MSVFSLTLVFCDTSTLDTNPELILFVYTLGNVYKQKNVCICLDTNFNSLDDLGSGLPLP